MLKTTFSWGAMGAMAMAMAGVVNAGEGDPVPTEYLYLKVSDVAAANKAIGDGKKVFSVYTAKGKGALELKAAASTDEGAVNLILNKEGVSVDPGNGILTFKTGADRALWALTEKKTGEGGDATTKLDWARADAFVRPAWKDANGGSKNQLGASDRAIERRQREEARVAALKAKKKANQMRWARTAEERRHRYTDGPEGKQARETRDARARERARERAGYEDADLVGFFEDEEGFLDHPVERAPPVHGHTRPVYPHNMRTVSTGTRRLATVDKGTDTETETDKETTKQAVKEKLDAAEAAAKKVESRMDLDVLVKMHVKMVVSVDRSVDPRKDDSLKGLAEQGFLDHVARSAAPNGPKKSKKKGMAGWKIGVIVVGVLAGVALLGAGAMYIRKKRTDDTDYREDVESG